MKRLCVDNEVAVVMAVNQAGGKLRYQVFSGSEETRTDCRFVLDLRNVKTLTSILSISCCRQNNEADILFFLKIHTFESLFRSHVSSELGTVNVIEIQGYSNLGQGLNNDNVIGVSCMCTPKFCQ